MPRAPFLFFALASSAFAAEVDLGRDEYAAVFEYRALKDNPKNQKVADGKLRAQAAKAGGISKSAFDAALRKADGYGNLSATIEAGLRKRFEGTALAKRVGTVVVDVSHPHVVIGVKWSQADVRDIDEEAATIAAVVKEEAPIVGTLAIWAVDGADRKVFTAKVGYAALQSFNLAKVKEYAHTRYLKLFEDVRRGEAAEREDRAEAAKQAE
jgi:hypothetical protein